MFNYFKTMRAIKREAKREVNADFKAIMNELKENANAPVRTMREDEKLMIELAKLELYAKMNAELRNI